MLYIYYFAFLFNDGLFLKYKGVVFVLSCHAFIWYSLLDFVIVEEMRKYTLFKYWIELLHVRSSVHPGSLFFYGTVCIFCIVIPILFAILRPNVTEIDRLQNIVQILPLSRVMVIHWMVQVSSLMIRMLIRHPCILGLAFEHSSIFFT